MALPIIQLIACTSDRLRKTATANFVTTEAEKISGFGRKSITRQNSSDLKISAFKVCNINSGFKICGDITKPGS